MELKLSMKPAMSHSPHQNDYVLKKEAKWKVIKIYEHFADFWIFGIFSTRYADINVNILVCSHKVKLTELLTFALLDEKNFYGNNTVEVANFWLCSIPYPLTCTGRKHTGY